MLLLTDRGVVYKTPVLRDAQGNPAVIQATEYPTYISPSTTSLRLTYDMSVDTNDFSNLFLFEYNEVVSPLWSIVDSDYADLFTLPSGFSFCKKCNGSSGGFAGFRNSSNTYTTSVNIGGNVRDSFLTAFEYNGKYALCQISLPKQSAGTYYHPNNIQPSATPNILYASIAPDDPYGLNENNTPSGGYGDFDYTSEIEIPPSLPSISAANAGFVTLWNPTISEVGDLADYLWSPTFSVATWQKLWNDPMECLLSLGIIPVSPTTGARANIYFGNADTGIESSPITTQFVKADMGSMHIDGKSASYMDYAPYAKASIYLPYCGTYALDVDEIMDADLALEYHIDIYTGACVAYLTINNRTNSDGSSVHSIMYQFTGNCLASIPVTSGDHSQLLQSLLFMGASIAATVATSGAGAASGGAIEGLAAEGDVVASSGVLGAATAGSAINTVMSMKPNVMHSGNLSSTAGLLGGQKPFVTFTWSNLCRPNDEYQLVGMPIQKSGTLSDFKGFTIVSACHMDNILCTDAERSMIEQALGRGVII